MDIKLDGSINGIETTRQIHKISAIPVIFPSAYSDMKILSSEDWSVPTEFVAKPFNGLDAISTIDKMLQDQYRMLSFGDGITKEGEEG
jgi:CheY-like chemotaxis protein